MSWVDSPPRFGFLTVRGVVDQTLCDLFLLFGAQGDILRSLLVLKQAKVSALRAHAGDLRPVRILPLLLCPEQWRVGQS
jgi:hypothetical protein